MQRFLLVVTALFGARIAVAQTAAAGHDMLIGRCIELRPASDSVHLTFSTGFTVVTFTLALTGSDTLHGLVNLWTDDGNTTYRGGEVTLSFPPCSQLVVR